MLLRAPRACTSVRSYAAGPPWTLQLCALPQKELREIERDKTSGVTVQLNGSSLQRLTGYVEGASPRACCAAAWQAASGSVIS